MKERILYFDALKGFAILLVVMGHVIAWNFSDRSTLVIDSDSSDNVRRAAIVFTWIYSFHMPLFFMVSGYFSYKNHLSLGRMMWRRSISYLFPYLTTGFFMLALRGYYGYWFLLSLWQLTMISLLYSKLCESWFRKRNLTIEIILLLVLSCALEFYSKHFELSFNGIEMFKFAGYSMPFFFGYLLHKYEKMFQFFICKRMLTYYIIVFAWLFWAKMTNFQSIFSEYNYFNWIGKSMRLLPFAGSLIFFVIFHEGINPKIEALLSKLGGGKSGNLYLTPFICYTNSKDRRMVAHYSDYSDDSHYADCLCPVLLYYCHHSFTPCIFVIKAF